MKREQIRKLLWQREILVYLSQQHPIAKVIPLFIVAIGIFLLLPIEWDFSSLGKYSDAITKGFKGLQQSYFGAVFIIIGFGLYFQAQDKDKYNINFVTNYRVYEKSGRISTKEKEIFLHHVKSIKIRGNIITKLMHSGKMIIEDDSRQHRLVIDNVSEPKEFKQNIEAAVKRFAPMTKKMEKAGKFKELRREHEKKTNR
jgi:hypothetical protein